MLVLLFRSHGNWKWYWKNYLKSLGLFITTCFHSETAFSAQSPIFCSIHCLPARKISSNPGSKLVKKIKIDMQTMFFSLFGISKELGHFWLCYIRKTHQSGSWFSELIQCNPKVMLKQVILSALLWECIKVALYSEICLVFMFNGGSSSSLTICPIDKKMNVLLSVKQSELWLQSSSSRHY